jgi:hypothetical protein
LGASFMDILTSFIDVRMFYESITSIMDSYQEDELFSIWLHKVDDKGYEEFKHSLKKNDTKTDQDVVDIINFSMQMKGRRFE